MNKNNLHDRRYAVIDLYSEGRSQREIASRLKISQATVHRDIAFERERIRKRSEKWLEEQLPFEHNACSVGLNKILRYAWDLVNAYGSADHKKTMDALDLAKDCYDMKIKLLGHDRAIKYFVDFYAGHRSEAADDAADAAEQQAMAEALERERNRSQRKF